MAKEAKKADSAFMKPMNVSEDLAAVIGQGPMPRSAVTAKIWEYIKGDEYVDKETGKKGSSLRKGSSLQNAKDKRIIDNDEALKKVFDGQKTVHMMKMAGYIGKHLS